MKRLLQLLGGVLIGYPVGKMNVMLSQAGYAYSDFLPLTVAVFIGMCLVAIIHYFEK